ncbi:MAG: flavin reductase family protein [Chitinivibrionia bacterium]|nr:flavin reductase family protein [Chitinivibrionia bacterium]
MKNTVKAVSAALICAVVCVIAITAVTGFFNVNDEENKQTASIAEVTTLSREEIKARSFEELFKTIDAKDIPQDVFTLISKDFAVITAGDTSHYNSMVAGWGGWGVMFSKPTTFLMLRSNRYTLELMRKEKRYTFTFFDDEYKNDVMAFGQKSGRDGDEKMKNTQLSAVETPDGNIAFKEAKLIIECSLVQITTVSPDDFYTDESKTFIVNAYGETNDYHKIVFGEITNVWVSK